MLSREGKQTDRGAVGAEFIGYNRRRREALLLQEFPHQPNCRPSVPAGLNQEIQDFALTVHGTPEIELPPSNYDDHLVQVPAFGRSWPPTLNPPRIGPTEFQDPSSNCLIRDVETTLGKQVLNVPIAQRETAIEPDGMLDDDRWKAVTTVGYLAHPETLKHRPCRSHAVNVTMPIGRFVHLERSEILTAGGSSEVREKLIFPRFQQLDAVRRLMTHARGHGPGHNYLIQHSAGSGKSNTIGWTAHQVTNLHDDADKRIFSSAIIVTDRIVLDRLSLPFIPSIAETLEFCITTGYPFRHA